MCNLIKKLLIGFMFMFLCIVGGSFFNPTTTKAELRHSVQRWELVLHSFCANARVIPVRLADYRICQVRLS